MMAHVSQPSPLYYLILWRWASKQESPHLGEHGVAQARFLRHRLVQVSDHVAVSVHGILIGGHQNPVATGQTCLSKWET